MSQRATTGARRPTSPQSLWLQPSCSGCDQERVLNLSPRRRSPASYARPRACAASTTSPSRLGRPCHTPRSSRSWASSSAGNGTSPGCLAWTSLATRSRWAIASAKWSVANSSTTETPELCNSQNSSRHCRQTNFWLAAGWRPSSPPRGRRSCPRWRLRWPAQQSQRLSAWVLHGPLHTGCRIG